MTTDMGLDIIHAGTAQFTWATQLNNNFAKIDTHDHSPGKGVALSSINIKVYRDFSIYTNVSGVGYLNFYPQLDTVTPNLIFSYGGDLFFNDNKLRRVQITVGNSLDVGSATGGGFSGDYVSAGAECYYHADTQLYSFTSDGTALSSIITQAFNLNQVTVDNTSLAEINPVTFLSTVNRTDTDFMLPTPATGTDIAGLFFDSMTGAWQIVSQATPWVQETDTSTTNTFTSLAISTNISAYNDVFYCMQEETAGGTDIGYVNLFSTQGRQWVTSGIASEIFTSSWVSAPYYFDTVLNFQTAEMYVLRKGVVDNIDGLLNTGDDVLSYSAFLYRMIGNNGDTITFATGTAYNPTNTPQGFNCVAQISTFSSISDDSTTVDFLLTPYYTWSYLWLPCLQTQLATVQEFTCIFNSSNIFQG